MSEIDEAEDVLLDETTRLCFVVPCWTGGRGKTRALMIARRYTGAAVLGTFAALK
jgi:hypothetical protein